MAFTQPPAISTSATSASWVSAADLDGDGDLDAASLADVGNEPAWYENRSTRISPCGFDSALDPPAANLGCFSSFTS